MAENIEKYTDKGLRVLVHGRINTGSYEKDGQRVYTTDVVVSNIEFIDWKNDSQNSNNPSESPFDKGYEYQTDFSPVKDNRIPF